MKRGTLLLALALLLQGSTSLAVLGNGKPPHKKLTRGQRRAARRALAEASATQTQLEKAQFQQQKEDVASIIAEVEGAGAADKCFEATFGPHLRSQQEADAADQAAAQEQAEAAVAEATAAADAALAAHAEGDDNTGWNLLDGIFGGAGAGAQAEPTAQEVAAQEAAQAQAEKDAAAAALKAEQEATAEKFVEWQKIDGVQDVVGSVADAAAQMNTQLAAKAAVRSAAKKVTAKVSEQAMLTKEQRAKRLFAHVLTEIAQQAQTPSYDEQFDGFEDTTASRRPAVMQTTHSATWKALTNPSDPTVLIGLLSGDTVPDAEVNAYAHYVDQAIARLAARFKTNHAQRAPEADIPTREAICAMNKKLSWTLMKLLDLARKQDLSVSAQSQQMVLKWVAENDTAIAELDKAQQAQRAELEEAQQAQLQELRGAHTASDVADRLGQWTLRARIAQCGQIKADAYQTGPSKGANIAQAIQISQELAAGLQSGTANLNDAALFIAAVQEKAIPVDLGTLFELKEAITACKEANEAAAVAQAQKSKDAADTLAQDADAFDARATELTGRLGVLLGEDDWS